MRAGSPSRTTPSGGAEVRILISYALEGRLVGVLVTDGADGAVISNVKDAAEAAGAQVQVIAPKIGGVTLKDRSKLKADRQLQGAPSLLFDAVALVVGRGPRTAAGGGCGDRFRQGRIRPREGESPVQAKSLKRWWVM